MSAATEGSGGTLPVPTNHWSRLSLSAVTGLARNRNEKNAEQERNWTWMRQRGKQVATRRAASVRCQAQIARQLESGRTHKNGGVLAALRVCANGIYPPTI